MEGSDLFYLHYEAQDRMFAFTNEKKGKEMNLDEVIKGYGLYAGHSGSC